MAEIRRSEATDYEGNKYYLSNDTESTLDPSGIPLNNGGDLSEASVNFTVGTTRKALTPKARFKALMGDIAKWLTDLGTAAFKNVANNDTTTAEGFVADARIVKQHGDEIDHLNSDLGGLSFFEDTTGKYVVGADSVPKKLGDIGELLPSIIYSFTAESSSNYYPVNKTITYTFTEKDEKYNFFVLLIVIAGGYDISDEVLTINTVPQNAIIVSPKARVEHSGTRGGIQRSVGQQSICYIIPKQSAGERISVTVCGAVTFRIVGLL